MEVLLYNDLEAGKLKKSVETVIGFLKEGNFRAADVKKMPTLGLYRAKLDDTNRLLFKIGVFGNQKYLFILEVIANHAYEKSRFMNGVAIDENKLVALKETKDIGGDEVLSIGYVNPHKKSFHLLDKILSFDESQLEILKLETPSIVIGSAGSGKTALTLEKLKTLQGKILYVTLSSYLIENASALYSSFEYDNPRQEVEFLSFFEYLSTINVPVGKEVDFRSFDQWIGRYRQSHKIKDSYKIFEEIKGVLTGSVIDKPWLSLNDYLELGVKQSIFPAQERAGIYDLFTKYLGWLKEGNYFDSNILSFHLLQQITPQYDYVVIDEVQDITNIQLMLVLKSLIHPHNFILCGDSNQIVHPNFFSWAQVKTLFYKQDLNGEIIRILATNYRNTREVTRIANQLLLVKNARFGSIDKESTYLVKPNSTHKGEVEFLENTIQIKKDLNEKTKRSTNFAVLVLRNEDKAAAKSFFQTPLLFSIQEAKGLEYENIILFNTISDYDREFRELTNGVSAEDLNEDNLKFSRARDKSDKSLDEYKFYVNSLYVGITRAVKNLYIIETNKKHELLILLGLIDFKQNTSVKVQTSSKEDWQKEAHRLEIQGKQEQADAIRNQILEIQPVPWEVITRENLNELIQQALHPELFNKKAKDKLYKYALYYGETSYFSRLAALKYQPANRWQQEGRGLINRFFAEYQSDNIKVIEPKIRRYGIDFRNEFNLTPFMIAISFGAEKIAAYLIANGANQNLKDNYGRSVLQLALLQAHLDPRHKAKVINRFYGSLKLDSIRIKLDNRLIKLDNHQGEFLMLHFMIATLREKLISGTQVGYDRKRPSPFYESEDYIKFYSGLSDLVIPEYRQTRTYISSLLAKNEKDSNDKYGKKLFVRIQLGFYLPNPEMEVLIDKNWVNLYDLIDIDNIEQHHARYKKNIFDIIRTFRSREDELNAPSDIN